MSNGDSAQYVPIDIAAIQPESTAGFSLYGHMVNSSVFTLALCTPLEIFDPAEAYTLALSGFFARHRENTASRSATTQHRGAFDVRMGADVPAFPVGLQPFVQHI